MVKTQGKQQGKVRWEVLSGRQGWLTPGMAGVCPSSCPGSAASALARSSLLIYNATTL
jgi:hypothetical protein